MVAPGGTIESHMGVRALRAPLLLHCLKDLIVKDYITAVPSMGVNPSGGWGDASPQEIIFS